MNAKPLIEIRAVDKIYRTHAGDFAALRQINLDVYPGEFIGVVGKSGSGKSTLANMLTGIDHPTSGQVTINGTVIHRLGEGRMSVWRGRNMGIVFQFFQLLPMLTVIENVMVPMDFCGLIPAGARDERALELLNMVGLVDVADKYPSEISGGQQQSVAIARALANDPPIVIADEPTGNLDAHTAGEVFELLQGLVSRGKTVIMVTHDQSLARHTNRTVTLVDGVIVREDLITERPA